MNSNKVDLKWVTESEVNNNYFNVERSSDGVNWSIITTTEGAGNSNQMMEYFEVDHEPLEGISYYRLRQTDFDGFTKFFNVVPVNNTKAGLSQMNLFPSVISSGETVKIEFDNIVDKELLVVIRDVHGREFYSKAIINIEKGQLIGLPIDSQIPSGVYLITASSENKVYSKRLIIK